MRFFRLFKKSAVVEEKTTKPGAESCAKGQYTAYICQYDGMAWPCHMALPVSIDIQSLGCAVGTAGIGSLRNHFIEEAGQKGGAGDGGGGGGAKTKQGSMGGWK